MSAPDKTPVAPPASDPPPSGQLLTVKAAASFLGFSEKSLRHRIDRGQIPVVRSFGRSVHLRRSDLLRLIGEGRGQSPSRSR